jgi:hypothetical protein
MRSGKNWQVIGRINSGQSICQTTKQFSKSKRVMHVCGTGNVKIRPGRGCKRKTTVVNDRPLVLLPLRNRFKPVSTINSVFRTAIRRRLYNYTVRLKASGLKLCHSVVRLRMTAEHRRLQKSMDYTTTSKATSTMA